MIDRIVEIVNESLDGLEITKEQKNVDLTTLGLTSISLIRMIVALEDEYGCLIPDDKLFVDEMSTLSKILNVLYTAINS